jgi:DNA-binding response OmpR family regulator
MSEHLARTLREAAYQVEIAPDGDAALEITRTDSFDVVLLVASLPGISGLDVARQLRCRKQDIGLLMIRARATVPDVIAGLDAGADDYLVRPFSTEELLARIRALTRRLGPRAKNILEYGDLLIETNTFRAFRAGREVNLSLTEFRLLELLLRNAGRVVSRSAIIEALWGHRREVAENTIDAFVRLVRRKIDDTGTQRLIRTHRGVGYSVGVEHPL